MIKSMVTALLAAASLVPMAASAQQWQGRGDRPEGQAQDGRAHQGHGDRGQRPQGQPQVQAGVQAQVQARPNVQQRGDIGQRGGFRGQQPVSQFQDNRAGAIQAENDKVQDWANGQNRDPRSGGGYRDGGNARPDQRGQQGDRNRDDQRGRDGQYRGGQDRGGQYRGDQYRGGQDRGVNQYRGGQNDRGGQYRDQRGNQNRGAWNRGWRNDGQYNWNGYRAQNRDRFHLPRYYAPGGWNQGYRRFSSGIRLNAYLYDRSYWINDPYDYRLPEAYGPYRWVRYYDDALLVDLRSGQVVDTVYGIFW